MKYVFQFLVIMVFAFVGEMLRYFIPLPVPASIYGIVLHVPSLDERKDDIPLLVNHFIGQISNETGLLPKEFSPEAIKMLQDKSWTGNIRELRNVVERLMILGGNPVSEGDVKDYVFLG